MIELFVTETSYGLLPVAHELVLRCRRYERFGIGPRKLVHRHHGLGGFDLPHGAEFLEFAERIYRYHAVLKHLCYFIAYAVEQPKFITDSCYIDVERTGEALLGNPLLESLQDHLVFLHDCHAADLLIVSDCLIIVSDEERSEERRGGKEG